LQFVIETLPIYVDLRQYITAQAPTFSAPLQLAAEKHYCENVRLHSHYMRLQKHKIAYDRVAPTQRLQQRTALNTITVLKHCKMSRDLEHYAKRLGEKHMITLYVFEHVDIFLIMLEKARTFRVLCGFDKLWYSGRLYTRRQYVHFLRSLACEELRLPQRKRVQLYR
jgi:hypothetical protein